MSDYTTQHSWPLVLSACVMAKLALASIEAVLDRADRPHNEAIEAELRDAEALYCVARDRLLAERARPRIERDLEIARHNRKH